MACRRDPREWRRVEEAIFTLLADLRAIRNRIYTLSRDAEILWRDLHSWDMEEEICYDEFWSRIKRIEDELAGMAAWIQRRQR